jgi:hypothetical protein
MVGDVGSQPDGSRGDGSSRVPVAQKAHLAAELLPLEVEEPDRRALGAKLADLGPLVRPSEIETENSATPEPAAPDQDDDPTSSA